MEPSKEKFKGTVDVILSEMIHNDTLVYSPFTVDLSSLIFTIILDKRSFSSRYLKILK